jgi:hypothetical protein
VDEFFTCTDDMYCWLYDCVSVSYTVIFLLFVCLWHVPHPIVLWLLSIYGMYICMYVNSDTWRYNTYGVQKLVHSVFGVFINKVEITVFWDGRNIVIDIGIRYGMEGTECETRWGRDFPDPFRPAPMPTQPLYIAYQVSLHGVKRRWRGSDHTPLSSVEVEYG